MKAVDFAVSRILPEDMRQADYDLSKKGMANIMAQVASKYPDRFGEIAKRLGDLGRNAAWYQGYTTSGADTRPIIDTSRYYAQMDAELDDIRSQKLDKDEYNEQRSEIYMKYSDMIEKDTMKAALSGGNNFARAVASGARGNAAHVKAILSTPGIYTDSKGRVIPMFVRNSFAGGLRPAEVLAGTYGARSAVVSTKKSTAKGGDLLKIMTQGTLNYNVTEKDCGVGNGIDLPSDDDSLTGRVLAVAAGDLPAGTVIDRQALARLRKNGKPVMVRSAMTCDAAHGLCSKCVGVQADGYFPKIGDSIGVTASAAIGEPIVQSALNVKHNCLVINTLVRMADYSVKCIQDIRPGDWVMGANILGETFPVQVLELWDQGMQPVKTFTYRLSPTRQTREVTCTEDHPLLQITTYRRAKEEVFNHTPRKLPAGRVAGKPSVVLPGNHTPVDGLLEEPNAKVVGYLLGDGIRITEGESSPKLSCADASTSAAIGGFLTKMGMHLRKVKRSHDWIITGDGHVDRPRDDKGHFLSGDYRCDLRYALGRLGLVGIYAHEKKVPAEVLSWSNASVADLIANYMSADGSVFHAAGKWPGISFSSTAKPLLDGVKELLELRFGVYGSALTITAKAGKRNHKRDLWAFTITRRDQVKRFADVVRGRTFGKKAELLDTLIAKSKASHMDLPFYKAKRVSIEDKGSQPCWDITVDHEDSLFVLANGLIVKNSGMAKGKKSFSGFNYVSQFVQIPEEFKDKAAVSERDGMVEKIEDAPQGGKFITVNGEQHFALPGFEPTVKVGDTVEAGDQLSDGLVNPADIVRLRGLGEGRRYYADRLGQILTDSGNPPDRRNVEILARSAVDNYITEDPDEDSPWQPDESVRSSDFSRGYTPPKDTADTHLSKAVGSYLQKPALHYTIGTRLTPKMITRMQSVGIENVSASRTEPWFRPEMQRLRTAAHDSKDWLVSMGTSYLSSQMRDALERGDETNVQENYHFGPRLAYGADAGKGAFGEHVEETGKF